MLLFVNEIMFEYLFDTYLNKLHSSCGTAASSFFNQLRMSIGNNPIITKELTIKNGVVIHTLLHIKCLKFGSMRSSHLTFKMH